MSACTPALLLVQLKRLVQAPCMSLTHVDLIGAKKDVGLAAIKQLSIDSAQDAGILRYDVLQQSSRANHLTLVEVWRGKAALEKHEVAAHTRKFRDDTSSDEPVACMTSGCIRRSIEIA